MTATHERQLLRTPGLVDAHIHPDKTSWGGPWMSRRPAATLQELIENDRATQFGFDASVEQRSHALLSHALENGTLAMRAHVDVSSELGTANVEGVRAAAERLAPHLTVQIVAFPQFGLLTNPGTLEVMAAALDAGADLVGGIAEIADWAGPESATRLEFAAESVAQLVADRPAPMRVIRGGTEVPPPVAG